MTTNEFLAELFDKRKTASVGGNPHRMLELYGAQMVEITAFEPDPATYRHDYYYNCREDRLYKRVVTQAAKSTGLAVAHWQPAREY